LFPYALDLGRVGDIDLAVIMADRLALEHVFCGTINASNFRGGIAVAKVAIARQLALRLYWNLRTLSGPAPREECSHF